MAQGLYALTLVFIIVLQLLSSDLHAQDKAEFLPADQAFQFSYRLTQRQFSQQGVSQLQTGKQLQLSWQIAPGYYLYEKRLKITDQNKQGYDFTLLTQPEEKDDPNFGLVKVFHDQLQLSLDLQTINGDKLTVKYQGCSENGLCYPPKRQTLSIQDLLQAQPDSLKSAGIAPTVQDSGSARSSVIDSSIIDSSIESTNTQNLAAFKPEVSNKPINLEQDAGAIASMLASAEGYWVVLTFLVLGLGLTFTPCVLPMVPILAGIIAGQGQRITVRKGIGLSIAYVLGMSVTYTLAGLLVGYFGAKMNLQASLQSPTALIVFAGLFTVLALSMFGFYELQLPGFLRDRLDRMGQNSQGGQYLGVALMGLISALVVSPCVSAPLAGALVYISTTGDAVLGGASLFALSLGMGLPLILVGAGGGSWLPKAGRWMIEVKAFFGVLLLGVAISLLSRLIPGSITLLLWALLLIVYAMHLGSFGQSEVLSSWGRARRGLSVAMLVYGISLMLSGLAGQDDPLQPLAFAASGKVGGNGAVGGYLKEYGLAERNLAENGLMGNELTEKTLFSRYDSVPQLQQALQQASLQNKPVVIDLYADWCASCKTMEKNVFNQPEILALAEQAVFLQLDITDNSDEQIDFLQQHGLFGPPSLLFYQSNGRELSTARVQGELGPEQFVQQLQKIL